MEIKFATSTQSKIADEQAAARVEVEVDALYFGA